MKKLIYYPPGTYGTFISWLCNTSGPFAREDLPFGEFGNSHKHYLSGIHNTELFLHRQRDIFLKSSKDFGILKFCWSLNVGIKLTNIDQLDDFYYRTCKNDLENFMQYCDQILVLHPTEHTKVWWYQNFCEKAMIGQQIIDHYKLHDKSWPWVMTVDPVQRARHHLDLQKTQPGLIELFAQYNKTSALEFTVWQLRTAMSQDLHSQTDNAYQCWQQLAQEYPGLKFVSLEDLRDRFQQTAQDILNFFSCDQSIVGSLPFIETEWAQRQQHQFKDALVNSIVDAVVNNQALDWTDKTNFFDEVYIQKLLNDRGITLLDHDVWPTTTHEFWKMIK